ncbi:MAG: chromosomal replication initiator protein DnaA [Thermoleophilaceae bacterium]|nr:chromosomal replication initiator protein DnaA [Thermoleophilaceae bacterium]
MSPAPENTWLAIRDELRGAVPEVTFQLWLDPLELAAREGARIYVRAPSHVRRLVEDRYLPLLRSTAGRIDSLITSVEMVDEDWAPAVASDQTPAPVDDPGLNPRYSFDQFVIGDGNRFAHAAALTVAELPGQAYNPLFIHGPPGLGKTHLLHAIGNLIRTNDPSLAVLYSTLEGFTSSYTQSARKRDFEIFRARYRSADVLLLDDVQFLAAKVGTMEELFHTFNILYESGRQLVITSDRSPSDLADFEDRLRERFGSGLVVALERPEFDVRLAILRKRASGDVAAVGEEVLEEVAKRVNSSVRALEGALIRVVAHASMRGEDPSADLAREVVGPPLPEQRGPVTVPAVLSAVAEAYGITVDAILAHDRRSSISKARQIAMLLARDLTDESLPAIGAAFAGRNHSTVIHACRRATHAIESEPRTRELVDKLRSELLISR